MPIETIKCQECGSADVTEFKPGSYVCGHCEAIFKHVTPADGSGGCQIGGCGVPAVGKCNACARRFCTTHQVRDKVFKFPASWEYIGRVARCTACHEEQI